MDVSKKIRTSVVVACTKDRVIGAGGALPWDFPEDRANLARLAVRKPLIMGRRTFEGSFHQVPGPCIGSANFILSRSPDCSIGGAVVCQDLEEAIQKASAVVSEGEILILGGETVFRASLDVADRIYMTEIDAALQGDAFFPALDAGEWTEVNRSTPASCSAGAFSYVTYERVARQ